MSSLSPTTNVSARVVPQFAVLWFDPRSPKATYTVPFVQSDAELKARLAHAIQSVREERQLSRPDLARMVGVSRNAVLAWENAETLPSLLNLGPICDALEVDANLFAHPPEIPTSPVLDFLLERESKDVVGG